MQNVQNLPNKDIGTMLPLTKLRSHSTTFLQPWIDFYLLGKTWRLKQFLNIRLFDEFNSQIVVEVAI